MSGLSFSRLARGVLGIACNRKRPLRPIRRLDERHILVEVSACCSCFWWLVGEREIGEERERDVGNGVEIQDLMSQARGPDLGP